MGCIEPEHHEEHYIKFRVSFGAPLVPLFADYKQVVVFLQQSRLFQKRTHELQQEVAKYILNPVVNDRGVLALRAIDSVHKIHPLIYMTDVVCEEWLMNACLKHQCFIIKCNANKYHFENSFRKYIQFLYLTSKEPTMRIIPTEEETFMWHVHMQDNRSYKLDMVKTFGRVIEELEECLDHQLLKLKEESLKIRKKYLPEFRRLKKGTRLQQSDLSQFDEDD